MDTREEPRFRANESATLTVLGNPDKQMPCRVIDVSKSGIRVSVRDFLPGGAAIKIEWRRNFLVGITRYPGFEVGVQLLTCSTWKGAMRANFIPLRAKHAARRVIDGLWH